MRGCCSTVRSVWTTNHKAMAEPQGWPVRCGQTHPCESKASCQPGKSGKRDLCYQAKARESIFSLDTEHSPCAAGPPSVTSSFLPSWSHSGSCFPLSEPTPSQRHFYQSQGKGEAGIWEGVEGIRKEFASGNLFPPSAWDKLADGGFAGWWGAAQS